VVSWQAAGLTRGWTDTGLDHRHGDWCITVSWIGPAAKKALKYGPYVQQAWKHAGKPAQAAAQRQVSSWAARRTALQHADTVTGGSVLGVMHDGQRFWVVFSADEPVAAYPYTQASLDRLVAHADLSRRVTPEQARERRAARELRRRAREGAERLRRGRTREPRKEIGGDGT
jgi:hypothetical protein